jgi:glycosyltransferase involved in cell wall biosynthesis
MKVAVISAHYMPEVGYQEVHLARAYARLGHEVKVFTSAASVDLGGSVGKIKYNSGSSMDEKYRFEVLRLPALSFKSKAFSFALRSEVKNFDPQLMVILGVAKGFPAPLLSKNFHSDSCMVSLYGDAKEYLERNSFSEKIKAFTHDVGYKLLKEPLYIRAVKYCHRIILNIPESDDYFKSFLSPSQLKVYESKKLALNLGFDPEQYYFNKETRSKIRAKLGIKEDEVVLITSTRVNRRKNLEKIISLIDELNERGIKTRYILSGFLGDDYEKELKKFISERKHSHAFTCYPFLDAQSIRDLYCAADAGIWLKASISIQEAMGTGLPVILENKPSVNHLIKDGVNGWFFGKNNFEEVIQKAATKLSLEKSDREKLSADNASWLSYDSIAKKIIESVNDIR